MIILIISSLHYLLSQIIHAIQSRESIKPLIYSEPSSCLTGRRLSIILLDYSHTNYFVVKTLRNNDAMFCRNISSVNRNHLVVSKTTNVLLCKTFLKQLNNSAPYLMIRGSSIYMLHYPHRIDLLFKLLNNNDSGFFWNIERLNLNDHAIPLTTLAKIIKLKL